MFNNKIFFDVEGERGETCLAVKTLISPEWLNG